ncbi:AAA family ATPase [Rhodococcus sp. NPDC056960]|uniref:AAA family ATPase n=1 Tax=Rhodococcus sp. NPDC056960 TaxID=3345982 RepID=UPI00364350CD
MSDLSAMQPVQPLVDGLLYRDTLAQISGAPGSYKSFVTLGMACSVAIGQSWEGHHVPTAGPVVYCAAEGATGLRPRILAWCEMTGVDPAALDGMLHVLPIGVQLGSIVDVSDAVDIVQELGAVLLVLDTRARCTLGLEENSATEQGKAISAIERIQDAAQCTVLAVHHSAKGGTGGRGSSAWDGAVWSDLRVSSEGRLCTIHCGKHKDVEDGCNHEFKMVAHTVSEALMPGCSETQRSSLVAVQMDMRKNDLDSAPSVRQVAEIVRKTDSPEGLTRTQIVDLCTDAGIGKTAAYSAVKALITRGELVNVGTEKRARYVSQTPHIPEGQAS